MVSEAVYNLFSLSFTSYILAKCDKLQSGTAFQTQLEKDFSMSDSTNIAEKWWKWKQIMDLYINLAILGKSEKEKYGAFLYTIGQTGCDIYNTMTFGEGEEKKLHMLSTKLETYCKP